MTPHVIGVMVAENSLFKAIGDIFHPLFIAVATVLAFIYGIVPDYAAAIVILTVIIMVLLTPLTIKSTRSMMAMQVLQPEMQKLRQKYKGAENREQLNQEMMRLYREHGVSPTGGCLPMFLQMPALVVLYDVIRGLANTVAKGALLGTGHKHCHPLAGQTLCATPRYIPHTSAMYHDLVKTPGVMRSMGMNLAAKPLTHHVHWYDYVPYVAMVLVAVGLQYFQMAQMTRRNKKNPNASQVPQQMQKMQKVMPLIFAYIYFIVPVGVVIYMIVSSAIRVVTQDIIFRYGIVAVPGAERKIGAAKAAGAIAATAVPKGEAGQGAAPGRSPPPAPQGQQPGRGRAAQRRAGQAGHDGHQTAAKRAAGSSDGVAAAKPHPRSRSKRARKAR